MEDESKNTPTIPPNFVTIHQLRERWSKQQEQKQKEKEEQEQKLKAEQLRKEKSITEEKRDLTTNPKPVPSNSRLRRDKRNQRWAPRQIDGSKDAKAVESKGKAAVVDGNGENMSKQKRGTWKNKKLNKKGIARAEVVTESDSVENPQRDGEIRGEKEANAASLEDAPPKSGGADKIGDSNGRKSEFKEKTKDQVIETRVLTVDIEREFKNISVRDGNMGINGRVGAARMINRGRPYIRGYNRFGRREAPKQRDNELVWVKKGEISKDNAGGNGSSSSSSMGPE